MNTGIYYDIPDAAYRALPYVCSTDLKKFRSCPASVLTVDEDKPVYALGRAIHSYSGEGKEAFDRQFIVCSEKFDKRTVSGKNAAAEFEKIANGKTVLTQEQYDVVINCHNSMLTHPLTSKFLANKKAEVTVIWDDEATGLRCKARLDCLPDGDTSTVVDIKSTSDASTKAFSRSIQNFNYDIQAAHYSTGATAAGLPVDYFIFAVVGTSAPFQTLAGYLSPEWVEWSQNEWNRLMSLYADCKKHSTFPAYELPPHAWKLSDITTSDLLIEFQLPSWR